MGTHTSMNLLLPSFLSLCVLVQSRRHLCDNGVLPVCANGQRALYNRPTGDNKVNLNPVCSDGSSPTCEDGSVPKPRFNTCPRWEKKCPNGFGVGGSSEPFCPCKIPGLPCNYVQPRCPGGGTGFAFRFKRCPKTGLRPHRQCTRGKAAKAHCAWHTKDLNQPHGAPELNTNIRPCNFGTCPPPYNEGENRPANLPHHWPKNGFTNGK